VIGLGHTTGTACDSPWLIVTLDDVTAGSNTTETYTIGTDGVGTTCAGEWTTAEADLVALVGALEARRIIQRELEKIARTQPTERARPREENAARRRPGHERTPAAVCAPRARQAPRRPRQRAARPPSWARRRAV